MYFRCSQFHYESRILYLRLQEGGWRGQKKQLKKGDKVRQPIMNMRNEMNDDEIDETKKQLERNNNTSDLHFTNNTRLIINAIINPI